MKRIIPGKRLRAKVINLLEQAYEDDDTELGKRALRLVCWEFGLKVPRLYFKARIRHNLAGQCYEDGDRIDVSKPSVWKAEGRTRHAWLLVVLHEFGHHVLWADRERKADLFARRWLDKRI